MNQQERMKHCNLCENKIQDLKTGTRCALTNQKPDFNGACGTISLHEKFNKKLSHALLKYQLEASGSTTRAIVVTLIFVMLGLILITGGVVLFVMLLEAGWIASLPVALFVFGLAILIAGIRSFNKDRTQKRLSVQEMEEVQQFLDLYDLKTDHKLGITPVKKDVYRGVMMVNVFNRTDGLAIGKFGARIMYNEESGAVIKNEIVAAAPLIKDGIRGTEEEPFDLNA